LAQPAEKLVPASPALPYEIVCSSADERAWLEARKGGLGATDMAVVLGENPWRSQLELFAEKTGAVEAADLSDVEAVEWGKRLEPVIVDAFGARTKRKVRPAGHLLRSVAYPWALATLDAWNLPTNDGAEIPLEIKTTGAHKAEEWSEGPPEHYRIQIHHQMLVTNAERATIACLLGGQRLVWCDVDRDEVLIRKIIFQGAIFWERVLQRQAPEPDGSDSARRVIHRLFPHDTGATLELPMVLAETVDEWQALKAEKSALEKRIAACENAIKATLGDATTGVLPTGDAVSWKEQHRAEHVVPAGSHRVLRYHPTKGSK
jgi:putative phage-type endonuclease